MELGNNEKLDCQQNVTFKLIILNLLMKNVLPSQKKTGNIRHDGVELLRISIWRYSG
jgi:hypothetical protein